LVVVVCFFGLVEIVGAGFALLGLNRQRRGGSRGADASWWLPVWLVLPAEQPDVPC